MKKITIVHIFPDDKFFDKFADFYDSLEGVENRYLFYTRQRDYRFRLVKNQGRIIIVNSFVKYIKKLRGKDVDIVLFHTMSGIKFFLATILRNRTKVIWWSWGYDLYHSRSHMPAVIRLDMYLPFTKKLMDTLIKPESLYARLCRNTIGRFYEVIRRRAISRVNLLLPVCPIEYTLLKENCSYFKGGLAIYPSDEKEYPSRFFNKAGNVLVGNSLTYTNNHLDVFNRLYEVELYDTQKFIIPVNYGGDYDNPETLIRLSHFKDGSVIWLKDYLPIDEYMSIFNTVTHAVFGMIRQQAMGNIIYCLRSGVKLFLYKNSVVFKQLKEDGYVFFSIEDDLKADALKNCLSKDDAIHNITTYNELQKNKGSHEVLEQLKSLVNEEG